MRKIKNILSYILIVGVIIFNITSIAYASSNVPNEISINTGNKRLGTVDYKNTTISAYKITANSGIGYCLDINKEYPSGQNFKLRGDVIADVERILAVGYPNKGPAQLNLKSEDEAYFATQIAIWSYYEGYDVYKFSGANKRVLDAIIDIYENSKVADSTIMAYEGKEYYAGKNTQNIVMLFPKIGGLTPVPPVKPIPPTVPGEGTIDPNIKPTPEPDTELEVKPGEEPVDPNTKPGEMPGVKPEGEESNQLPQTGEGDYYNYMVIVGVIFIATGSYLLIRKPKVQ